MELYCRDGGGCDYWVIGGDGVSGRGGGSRGGLGSQLGGLDVFDNVEDV